MSHLRKQQPGPAPRGQRVYKRTPVTNYYRSKNQPGLSPFKKKEPKKDHRKLLFGMVDILLLGSLLVGLVYSLALKAQPSVTASDLSYRSAATYQSQVEASFKGLKNRNKITFDDQGVVSNIQKQFPEVQNVQVELPFFSQEAKVRLSVSRPAFKLSNGAQVYVIDSQGVAVAKADSLPRLKNLISLIDQSGFEIAIGKQVLSSSSVSFINTVIAQSGRAKVPISSLTLPPLAQELDLRTADQPYFVKFYLGGNADLQAGQFLAARQKLAAVHQTPTEYLDVRVSGKIFYK